METYILRIYRRSPADAEALHGTVERVGVRTRNAFASRDELWAWLEVLSAAPERLPGSDQHDEGGSHDTQDE